MEILLWIIFIFVCTYYGMKLFFRFVLPYLLAQFIRKQQEKFRTMNYQETNENNFQAKNEKPRNRKDDQTFGDYVDYEEIK